MNPTWIKVIATGLGTGYSPVVPGTVGTLLGVPLYLLLYPVGWPLYFLSTLALAALACYVSDAAERLFQEKDPRRIVIDEIVGLLCALFWVTPTVTHVFAGFLLFRVLDVVKPFPAGLLQRRLPGGYGVVGDDIAAGIQANIVLQVLIAIWGI